jgi:ADP-ribose pyrophosphatase YjhB (NUDIX family)
METRIRIAGIIIQNGKLLMLLGKGYPELWTPGGKLEAHESNEECLARELKEEIGVNLLSMVTEKILREPLFREGSK